MTYKVKSEQVGNYAVTMEQRKFESWFLVEILEQCGGQWYTYRKSNPQPDMTRAKATYRRYLKEVKSFA